MLLWFGLGRLFRLGLLLLGGGLLLGLRLLRLGRLFGLGLLLLGGGLLPLYRDPAGTYLAGATR